MSRLVHVIHYLDERIMLIYMLLETLQHSDPNAHIYGSIKIGDEIFVREKEFSKGHHLANVVQFVGGGWLKVRWQWKGWRMANVHMSWIVNSQTQRKRTYVPTYDDDEIWITGLSCVLR